MATRATARTHIRWMIARDMEEVLAIEAASDPSPWDRDDFMVCLRRMNCIGNVAERGDRVVGYTIYRLERDKLQILKLAVLPSARKSRVGTTMVRRLIDKLTSHRRWRIAANVDTSNLAALAMLAGEGFQVTHELADSNEYLMQYTT